MSRRFPFKSLIRAAPVVLTAFFLSACAVVERAGVAVLYRKCDRPAGKVLTNQAYGSHPRQQLDFFLPDGPPGWPVAVFIHGGSWVSGSKDLTVGGADVYRNIGRFLAANGIGAAVINYRLQPEAGWRDQVADAAAATGWVRRQVRKTGGNPDDIFLFGHSAGAQLAAFTGLQGTAPESAGVPQHSVRGIIAVSGAGLDLTDAGTYALGHSPDYYRSIVDPAKTNPAWQHDGSAVSLIRPDSPPFLVMIGGREEKPMQRQSRRLHEALLARGVDSTFLSLPGQSHGRIVLALSRPDKIAGPAVLEFIRRQTR